MVGADYRSFLFAAAAGLSVLQSISLDKIVDLMPRLILDWHRLSVNCAFRLVALLLRDFGSDASTFVTKRPLVTNRNLPLLARLRAAEVSGRN